jgi:predicted Zn-dependent peptidase
MKFHQTTLPNGLEVIAELNPAVHSVAFGFFVRTGARDEGGVPCGVSHFLEHMVFKGTETLSAEEVNLRFDDVGANYNASTSEEQTIYHAAVLPEYFAETFALEAAIMYPSLREKDFETEKQVILEEIGMYDDQPMFVAYDKVMQLYFHEHPLGLPILGTPASVTVLTAAQMQEYHRTRYRAGNITLVVAGNTSWEEVLRLANKHCSHWPEGKHTRQLTLPAGIARQEWIVRDHLQTQQVMALCGGPAANHRWRFAADVLATIVGDDVNSRLYWALCDSGKAEIADVSYNSYDGCGTFMTYLSCLPETVQENLEQVTEIFDELNDEGPTAAELDQAKTKLAARAVVRGERPMSRLTSLGAEWLTVGEYLSLDDELAAIEGVSLEEITAVLKAHPLRLQTVVGVGPG